jgi:hypothetical protein
MYPKVVPRSQKKCTPNVPHLDFHKPHLKNRNWQPWVIQRLNPGLEILKVCPTKPIRNQRGANQ